MHLPLLLAALIAADNSAMRVLDAVYGNPDRGHTCDATAQVAQQCDAHATCVLAVGNGICGDPDYGVPKRLYLTYKCGALPARQVALAETAVVRIACDGAPPPAQPLAPQAPAQRIRWLQWRAN